MPGPRKSVFSQAWLGKTPNACRSDEMLPDTGLPYVAPSAIRNVLKAAGAGGLESVTSVSSTPAAGAGAHHHHQPPMTPHGTMSVASGGPTPRTIGGPTPRELRPTGSPDKYRGDTVIEAMARMERARGSSPARGGGGHKKGKNVDGGEKQGSLRQFVEEIEIKKGIEQEMRKEPGPTADQRVKRLLAVRQAAIKDEKEETKAWANSPEGKLATSRYHMKEAANHGSPSPKLSRRSGGGGGGSRRSTPSSTRRVGARDLSPNVRRSLQLESTPPAPKSSSPPQRERERERGGRAKSPPPPTSSQRERKELHPDGSPRRKSPQFSDTERRARAIELSARERLEAATKLQAGLRGAESRKTSRELKRARDSVRYEKWLRENAEKSAVAVKVQAIRRAKQARRATIAMRTETKRRDVAARAIQEKAKTKIEITRAKKARLDTASSQIQARRRGALGRKKAAQEKVERIAKIKAARVLLPHFKVNHLRMRAAAVKLQAVQRRHLYFKRLRDDADNRVKGAAATKIQGLQRGKSTRRRLQKQREDKERLRADILKTMSRGGLLPR